LLEQNSKFPVSALSKRASSKYKPVESREERDPSLLDEREGFVGYFSTLT